MAGPTGYIDEALLQYATDAQRKYLEAINTYGSARAAAAALGVNKNAVAQAVMMVRLKAATAGYAPDADLTRPVAPGFMVKRASTYYNKDGKPSGQWLIQEPSAQAKQAEMDARVLGMRDEMISAIPIPYSGYSDDDIMTVYPQGDPHAGLYSWEAETGARFDLAEFERVTCAAIDRLVDAAPASALALYNDKGDSTHADNNKNRTPGSGHYLDVVGRHSEVIRVVMRCKRHHIRRMLEKHAKVIVRIDPGNHDPETALMIALMMEAHYESEPRVEVITSPNPYWYYRFGKNLIGTCHGDGAKGKDLPMIMANDAAHWWEADQHRVWLVGHVHHRDVKEYTGCTVEYMRTLAASDAWHHGSGYRSKRDMQAITYHKIDGEIERATCSLARINRLATETINE